MTTHLPVESHVDGTVHLSYDVLEDGKPWATMCCGRWLQNPESTATEDTTVSCTRCLTAHLSTGLPDRYHVYEGRDGRLVLDDGSNFVAYLASGDNAVAIAAADVARKDQYRREYADALKKAAANGWKGWEHAFCDHAHSICSGAR